MTKRKRCATHSNVSKMLCVQDVIEWDGTTFYYVRNRRGIALFKQAKPLLQQYDRDVLTALTHRWINNETCPSLSTKNVGIRDNKAFLPLEGLNGRRDYPTLYLEYLIDVHGTDGQFRARDDLYRKLRQPMTLSAFKNIYFHPFHQGEEELSDFPARVVENIKFRKVQYRRKGQKWFKAYNHWERRFYGRRIDLIETVMVDLQLLRVYAKGNYKNTAAKEAALVRNIILHLNEQKIKVDTEIYDKTEMLEIIYDHFPDISFMLFEFCQYCGVDLDFTKLRKFYKA